MASQDQDEQHQLLEALDAFERAVNEWVLAAEAHALVPRSGGLFAPQAAVEAPEDNILQAAQTPDEDSLQAIEPLEPIPEVPEEDLLQEALENYRLVGEALDHPGAFEQDVPESSNNSPQLQRTACYVSIGSCATCAEDPDLQHIMSSTNEPDSTTVAEPDSDTVTAAEPEPNTVIITDPNLIGSETVYPFGPTAEPEAPMASAAVYPASEPTRWRYLDQIRTRPGPFTNPEAFDGKTVAENMEKMKVLVIGAGGLGCELLKNLAMSGFKNIHVIDMDTIDISNLNRQFLFRESDVGKSKAEVAAAFVERRVKGVKITPHNCKIQDFDEDFYMQFQIVVCGLDSIEARRWINATLVNMVDEEVEDSYKPLIDGGTEGFKGQTRVVLPTVTSCIECQLDMHAPRAAVPLCTLASIPRQPEHCVEWAHVIAWDQEKPFPQLDKDDPEHITWLYQKALARAEEFNIAGVTYALTQGVVKNIIPAIAATNSVIAAACCNEALKIASGCAPYLGFPDNNYMMYSGNDSIYTYTFNHERKADCPVCGTRAREITVDPSWTLKELVESFATRPEAQLKKPSVRAEGKTLYMQSPPSLEEQTRPNLEKTLTELGLAEGQEIGVTDPAFATVSFKFKLKFGQA